MCHVSVLLKHFNPNYPEWYGPNLDLEHTIQVCRGERVSHTIILFKLFWKLIFYHWRFLICMTLEKF